MPARDRERICTSTGSKPASCASSGVSPVRATCISNTLNTAVPATPGSSTRPPQTLSATAQPARLARRASGIQVLAPVTT